jgi:hypothetical protein
MLLRPAVSALLLGASLTACVDDATGPGSAPPATGEVTVDASIGFTYLAIDGDSLRSVAVPSPSTSTAWDIGLFGLSTVVNGGAGGPGNTSAFCLCRPTNLTIPEVQALNATTERLRFDAITAADIPAASSFRTDTLVPAIASWFTGAPGATATANSQRVFVFAVGQAAPIYGKFQIAAIAGGTATRPGTVTIRWAVQPGTGTAAFGTAQTQTFTLGSAPVYVNLITGATVSSASGDWHIAFDGWRIRANSGASGTGTVSVTFGDNTPFDVMSATIARSVPIQAFARDGFAGAFSQPDRQWEYVASSNTVYATYDIYLLRRGESVFKLQFPSYYDAQGQSRRITVRYQRLR